MNETAPVSHEQWCSDSELAMLDAATRFVNPLQAQSSKARDFARMGYTRQ